MELVNPNASKECIIQSLQWCVNMGHNDILKALLMTHFSSSKLSDMSEICSDLLIRAVSNGSCDLLKLLLPYVDDHFLSNKDNTMGKNYLSKMLCHAVAKGNKQTVELLLNRGANVNVFYEGKPLLHVAMHAGRSEIAKELIKNGANIDAALMPAIFSTMDNKEDVVGLLLQHGADPKLYGNNGRQPIHVAAAHSAAIIEKLVDVGCDVNTQDPIHGDTPLHVACSMCCTETVEALIRCGAKFNVLNNQGETPLHKLLKFATDNHDFHSQSRQKLAKYLVKLGFTVTTQSKVRTPKNKRGRDKVYDVYTKLMSTSKSIFTLQELCRLKMRDNIHTQTPNASIDSLDIPVSLITYLKFGNEFQ